MLKDVVHCTFLPLNDLHFLLPAPACLLFRYRNERNRALNGSYSGKWALKTYTKEGAENSSFFIRRVNDGLLPGPFSLSPQMKNRKRSDFEAPNSQPTSTRIWKPLFFKCYLDDCTYMQNVEWKRSEAKGGWF